MSAFVRDSSGHVYIDGEKFVPAVLETAARTFTGTLPTGVPVCVTVHDAEGVADLAFKHDDRWTAPVELSEEES